MMIDIKLDVSYHLKCQRKPDHEAVTPLKGPKLNEEIEAGGRRDSRTHRRGGGSGVSSQWDQRDGARGSHGGGRADPWPLLTACLLQGSARRPGVHCCG